ncbi:MAG: HDOD domain-containing protein [Gammaproteobacteria bacterium]|jgi:HD-like signal output (HDOD) protein
MGAEAAVQSKSFAFVESLATDLSNGTLELPSFPEIVIRIRKALEDDNCTTAKIAQLIGSEPALAARLLQIANSAAVRRGPEPVSDVNTAIGLLGWDIVRSSAMSFAMKQIRDGQKLKAAQPYLEVVWNEGVNVAALCHVLAKKYTKLSGDEAMLIGLLHGVGKLYILAQAEKYPELFEDEQTLYALLDEWHTGIGKAILESMDFSDEIAAAVGDYLDLPRQHEGDVDFTDLLMMARIVAGLLEGNDGFEVQLDDIPASLYFTTSVEEFFAILTESDEHISSLRHALGT